MTSPTALPRGRPGTDRRRRAALAALAALAESLDQAIPDLSDRLTARRGARGGIGREARDRDMDPYAHIVDEERRGDQHDRPEGRLPTESGGVDGPETDGDGKGHVIAFGSLSYT
ncbi:hypothetical protein ACWD7F_09520 [Streptomyces sp. NPDC005122]